MKHEFKIRKFMESNDVPVKNLTGNLMEIPGHFMSKIHGSLVKIHTKFHDYSMSFIQVLFVPHAKAWHGFWTNSSHGTSMASAKKMMDFPCGFGLIFEQTAVKKTWENPCVIYNRGIKNIQSFYTSWGFIWK